MTKPDRSAMPVDMATLYSRARLEGSRYWDFSASRMELRGKFGRQVLRLPEPPPPLAVAPRETAEQVQTPQVQPYQGQPPPLAEPELEMVGRWYALHSVFGPAEITEELPRMSLESGPPVLAVLSLAGGVGKTCLVATLGRVLSSLGEHALLADTAACGLLPFYFGSREFRPGVVRTFSPPGSPLGSAYGAEADVPVKVLNLQAERYAGRDGEQDPLLAELLRDGRGTSRILVDVATASREVTRRLLLLQPTVLVPVLPDISSVASLGLLQVLLADEEGVPGTIFFVLNQFDASLPLHVDVRTTLQQQLGDRLLPLVLRRSSSVSEALAEGMTVIDYAPESDVAEDYRELAAWLRSFSAPAKAGNGGARWSEV
jgi:cellulose synthase operon protein YhjQ